MHFWHKARHMAAAIRAAAAAWGVGWASRAGRNPSQASAPGALGPQGPRRPAACVRSPPESLPYCPPPPPTPPAQFTTKRHYSRHRLGAQAGFADRREKELTRALRSYATCCRPRHQITPIVAHPCSNGRATECGMQ